MALNRIQSSDLVDAQRQRQLPVDFVRQRLSGTMSCANMTLPSEEEPEQNQSRATYQQT